METLFNEDFEPGCYLLDIFFVHALEHFDCMFEGPADVLGRRGFLLVASYVL